MFLVKIVSKIMERIILFVGSFHQRIAVIYLHIMIRKTMLSIVNITYDFENINGKNDSF